MSTHIVDRIEAIRFTAEVTGHYRDRYLVCELGGDNNVRCARTNRRARTWSATAIGEEWEIIGQACRFAAACSGGMTRLHGRELCDAQAVQRPDGIARAPQVGGKLYELLVLEHACRAFGKVVGDRHGFLPAQLAGDERLQGGSHLLTVHVQRSCG